MLKIVGKTSAYARLAIAVPNGAGAVPLATTVSGQFALTFDDGSTELTTTLLDTLKSKGAKATFFVNGLNYRCIYDMADIIKRIVADGHQLAHHTWSHPDLTTLSDAQIIDEMTKLETAFRKIVGKVPRYMRPPYGAYDDRVRAVLGTLGYKMVLWDIDSGDSLGYSVSQSEQVYIDNSNYPAPHCALNHDPHSTTVNDVAPFAIDLLQGKGYTLSTFGQCVGDTTGWYKETTTPGTRDNTWVC
ncbi:5836_t:CDS:2 [Paraglomus occultum]|uniref:5836_t:CDS:1 n=1 Tax=Paraglomus occultum TaxID=144539 RepID=A0A9N9FQI9_9GLOM|nr:5836_t:CDS:2 [Paraglomus occultum]